MPEVRIEVCVDNKKLDVQADRAEGSDGSSKVSVRRIEEAEGHEKLEASLRRGRHRGETTER